MSQVLAGVSDRELERATREAVREEKARRKVHNYTVFTFGGDWVDSAFSRHMGMVVDRWIRGDFKRLMIYAPPQHGKSEFISVRLAAHVMSKYPGSKVMACSYAEDLIQKHSRGARRVAASEENALLFPTAIPSREKWANSEWEMNHHMDPLDPEKVTHISSYKCAGVDGGITGRGFTYGILDDLIKNRKAAESDTIRNDAWEFYESDFHSRKAKDARICYITTRWHHDDPAGRMMENMRNGGERWHVVNYMAFCETREESRVDPLNRLPNVALVPELHPYDELYDTKRTISNYAWASL